MITTQRKQFKFLNRLFFLIVSLNYDFSFCAVQRKKCQFFIMICDDVECHCQMGNMVAWVKIATTSRDCFKLQVQQPSLLLLTEHLVHSFVFDASIVQAIRINHQPDATIFQFIILTFIYSSTCFGRPHAHH